ncbi:MAG: HAMP domain-containing histidine kinase [Ruminococcus sp.]|nr:HAMP domain-containing histidine kinase [Ruminococcus sp.]
MELFDALISVYKNSDEKIILTDMEFNMIWKNNEKLPSYIDMGKIRFCCDEPPRFPLKKMETCEYRGDFGNSSALKIQPLFSGDEVCGYLMHFYTCEDIEIMSDRSGHLKYKANFLGNIRIELSRLLAMLDSSSSDMSAGVPDSEVRKTVIKTLSATVNYNELSKYYSGFFSSEPANISVIMDELCSEAEPFMRSAGIKFSFELDEAVYLKTNAERLKAAAANLLVNAAMYNSKEEKLCRLTLKCNEDGIAVTVSDNGDGIEPETAKKAVKPFGCFEGYGNREYLGLALANICCEFFGGHLEIKSQKGSFTDVIMRFPAPEKGVPPILRSPGFPPVPNPYGTLSCIFAKCLR